MKILTSKNAQALVQDWMSEGERAELNAATEPFDLFQGLPSDAINKFPSEVNDAVAPAWATRGREGSDEVLLKSSLKRVQAELVADPHATESRHEIEVSGAAGTFTFSSESAPSPVNPKTSVRRCVGAKAVTMRGILKLWCKGLVQFNHDNMTGPLLAVDLVSLEGRGWTIAGAGDVLAAHSIRSSDLVVSASENLREWSAKMRPVFMAPDEEARCTIINGLLREGTSRVYLTIHDQLSPHLHFTSDDDDVVSRVKAATAGGLAIFTVESQGARLGACQ